MIGLVIGAVPTVGAALLLWCQVAADARLAAEEERNR